MPSGYEKSPDYGGPPPTWWGSVLIVLGIAAGGAVGLAARMKKARAEGVRAGQWLLQWEEAQETT